VLGGTYKNFMGKIKRTLLAMGIGFFKIFTYNTQRFGGLLMDQHLLFFVCLFKIALQMTNHEKVKTHHPWAKPSAEPRCLWV